MLAFDRWSDAEAKRSLLMVYSVSERRVSGRQIRLALARGLGRGCCTSVQRQVL